ncbi:MAG: hypothetical protein NC393_14920 [Clostridium sp.]|nr:hypothetical protein [Clostridium sp.]MCM1173401.1 hypothetical protein [Clostridium sp.]
MEREKHLKKRYFYFLLSMVLAAALTGCKRKLRSEKYSEWVDAIGINEYPHVSCHRYLEYANGLDLVIGYYDSESADEFKKIIANHNAFVTRNPDYFPEDFDIDIVVKYGSQYMPLSFSNCTNSDSDKGTLEYYGDLSVIETEKTHRMRYAYPRNMENIENKFEAEIIIISMGKYMDEVENAQDWSEYFENFNKIVVDISPSAEREINIEEALEKIQRANPNAELYYITYTAYPDEYEIKKYTPEEN